MPRRPMRDAKVVSVDVVDTVLLGPNPGRIGIIISAPPTNRITVWFGGPAVLDQGIQIYPATLPLVIDNLLWGESLLEDVHAISAVGAQNISVIDFFG